MPPVDWRRFWVWLGLVIVLAIWIFSSVIEQGARLLFGIPPWVWPVVLSALAVELIALYHRRRMAKILGLELEAEGWQKIRPHQNIGWWICPQCRTGVPDLPGAAEEHFDPRYSACAAFTQRREEEERTARLDESVAPIEAEFVGVRGSSGDGSYDSMSEGDD